MKKAFLLCGIIFVSICLVVGCSKQQTAEVSVGIYVYEVSQHELSPNITIEKNQKFSFTYSPLSSYLARGTYEIKDNKLLLKTDDVIDDKKIQYVFEISDEGLIFIADESTPIPAYANVPDGAVFKK